jgi:hypothetical protein
MHNSFENTFVHEGHEGTRRKIFVSLRVLGGYFHPSWRAHAPMHNSFPLSQTQRREDRAEALSSADETFAGAVA